MIFMGHFEHQTQTKMNFIGPLETRCHIQKLLECFDRPENYGFVYISAWQEGINFFDTNSKILIKFLLFSDWLSVNLEELSALDTYGFSVYLSTFEVLAGKPQ